MSTKMIDEFTLDISALEIGTRFFEANYKFTLPVGRTKYTMTDDDGNEWYRYENPTRLWYITEFEVLGCPMNYIEIDEDTPPEILQVIFSEFDSDFYIRNVETGEVIDAYHHRDNASLEYDELASCIEEANRDHS